MVDSWFTCGVPCSDAGMFCFDAEVLIWGSDFVDAVVEGVCTGLSWVRVGGRCGGSRMDIACSYDGGRSSDRGMPGLADQTPAPNAVSVSSGWWRLALSMKGEIFPRLARLGGLNSF